MSLVENPYALYSSTMETGVDRSDIEFPPLKVPFGSFSVFLLDVESNRAMFTKFNRTPHRYKHELDCLTSWECKYACFSYTKPRPND